MNRTMGRKLWGVVGALGLVLTTGVIAIPTEQAVKVKAAPPLSPTDNSRVPHYFGPYSNWANSPQVLTDATVTITPKTGDITGGRRPSNGDGRSHHRRCHCVHRDQPGQRLHAGA